MLYHCFSFSAAFRIQDSDSDSDSDVCLGLNFIAMIMANGQGMTLDDSLFIMCHLLRLKTTHVSTQRKRNNLVCKSIHKHSK